MPESWRLEGEYLENCNCEVLCPCLLGPRNTKGGAIARPTEGHCDVPLVFRIEHGAHGRLDLANTHAALVVHTPGPMGDGHWTIGAYIDERARDEQRRALEQIFTGQAGGMPGVIWTLAGERLPTRVAPIEFGKDGRRRRARIGDFLDVEIEGIEGRQPGTESWIDNVRHPVSSRLAAARATRMTYRDHGFVWNNTGRNGHYSTFVWSGP
jgi:hypothetical protein